MLDVEGVLLKILLQAAAVQAGATEMVLTAGDDYSTTVALADVAECDTCGISIEDGVLGSVLPGQSGSAWVKDLRTIEI